MNRKKKIDKSNWVLVSHCLWKYIKRIVSFWMIYLSSERIFLGKRRLVLPILVNERLPQVSFRSGAYVSNNHFAKLSFSHIRYISTSFKGVPCSTCHLARLRKRQKKKKKMDIPQCISEHFLNPDYFVFWWFNLPILDPLYFQH